MRLALLFLSLAFLEPLSSGATEPTNVVLRTAAELSRYLVGLPSRERSFELFAKVTALRRSDRAGDARGNIHSLALQDSSGATFVDVRAPIATNVCAGDVVHVRGHVRPNYVDRIPVAVLERISVLEHDNPIQPVSASFQDIQSGAFDFRLIRIEGTVRDSTRNDSSLPWVILKLSCGEDFLDASVFSPDLNDTHLTSLIGATVKITGIATPLDFSRRTKMGRIFWCWSDRQVEVLQPPPDIRQPIPDITALSDLHPAMILRQGRHKAMGRVLATWQKNKILLLSASGDICHVELADARLPACGSCIKAVGFPESDLYHINLVRATWEVSDTCIPVDETICATSPRELMIGGRAHGIVDMRYHGHVMQITGCVCSMPDIENGEGILYLLVDGTTVSVDISSNTEIVRSLAPQCIVRVTGICVVDTPNWSPNALCQKTDRFSIVTRNPDDIVVLERPPWWTPSRLLSAGGILLAILVAILIWNRSLIVLAERRGRELLREQIGHVRATLKVDERTRLAVDLHDSLSQNLTGISLQLDLVNRLTGEANPAVAKHLDIAARTLQSCRNELRGCIWDLRSQALDALSMEDAIRMTLRPHLDVAKLSLRFPVPRRKLDDNTAHTLLRVIRELVSNALRHGAARSVRIAGAMEKGRLAVSVQDDGTGFDPSSRPNSGNGHFGLDGIRERLRHFDGNMTIDSSPGRGTKVTFSIRLPENGTDGGETHA